MLGGVMIPYSLGLDGHSDADVLIHAILDALLGAARLGDIGVLFPDTDEQYKGVSSVLLAEKTAAFLKKQGWVIVNIDATVVAQNPRISPYRDAMQFTLAKAFGVSSAHVSVKATTTERMGFEGRGEGISAQAVCLIRKDSTASREK